MRSRVGAWTFLCGLVSFSAWSGANIRVDATLVSIPVSVTDSRNHPVMGLRADQFRLLEDRAPQTILRLASENAPVSVGILFDASHSMIRKADRARTAVREFLKSAEPGDEFFLATFNSASGIAVPFTSRTEEIEAALEGVRCQGRTALLDAIEAALHTLAGAKNSRRALVIVSDGGDNHSRYTEMEVRRAVREGNVLIYAIGLYGGRAEILPEEERGGGRLLADIAEETGGAVSGSMMKPIRQKPPRRSVLSFATGTCCTIAL